jgi:hypothetical protein
LDDGIFPNEYSHSDEASRLDNFERLCKEKIKDGNNSNAMLMLVLLEKGMSFKVSQIST